LWPAVVEIHGDTALTKRASSPRSSTAHLIDHTEKRCISSMHIKYSIFLWKVLVVSTVAKIVEPSLTTPVCAALIRSSFPPFLPQCRKLSDQVLPWRKCGLERFPVRPTRAPPLCDRVCSSAYGPGLDHRDCPPQASPARPIAGQGGQPLLLRRGCQCSSRKKL